MISGKSLVSSIYLLLNISDKSKYSSILEVGWNYNYVKLLK